MSGFPLFRAGTETLHSKIGVENVNLQGAGGSF